MEIAKMYAVISANTSDLDKGLASTKEKLSALGSGFQQLQSMATAAVATVGVAIAGAATAVATTGIKFDALKESANTAFTTMLGSGLQAQNMLNELQAFAQKTPFEFPDLIRASQRLMAMGFQAHEVIPQLTAIGDAVAAMGGSAEMVDRVTLAIGQMHAKGKASGEEMRQLTEAGIPVWQMLADKIGVTVPEAMDKVSDGAVDAATAITAINEGIESRFGGMMDKQSQTWNGIISNIKDGFTQLSGTIMQPFFDMAKEGLQKVADTLGILQRAFQKNMLNAETKKLALANLLPESLVQGFMDLWERVSEGVTVIKALTKPITDAIAKFVSWQDVITAAGYIILSALANIVIAIAPVIAAFAALVAASTTLRWAWQHDFAGIRTSTLETVNKISNWFYDKSGLWKGTWEKTARNIYDIVYEFFRYKIPNTFMWYVEHVEHAFWVLSLTVQRTIDGWAQTTYDTITGWINDTKARFENWKDIAIQLWHEWTDPTIKKVEDWYAIQKSRLDNFIKTWQDKIKPWADWVVEKFQAVLDWWHDHIDPFVQYGTALVQGWWDAIRNKWNEFTQWWTGKWEDLKRRFKSFFGIASPSKVFASYGNDMMKGLAQGIQTGQDTVRGAMNGLNAGITTSATANYSYMPQSPSQPAVSTARIEDLLAALIQELRSKNMSVTVNGNGGVGLGSLVSQTTGLRSAI